MERLIEAALTAIEHRDWETLHRMLHPYVHWSEGGTRIRGRTKVIARLKERSVPSPPSSWELRDGQVYRWTA